MAFPQHSSLKKERKKLTKNINLKMSQPLPWQHSGFHFHINAALRIGFQIDSPLINICTTVIISGYFDALESTS